MAMVSVSLLPTARVTLVMWENTVRSSVVAMDTVSAKMLLKLEEQCVLTVSIIHK